MNEGRYKNKYYWRVEGNLVRDKSYCSYIFAIIKNAWTIARSQ